MRHFAHANGAIRSHGSGCFVLLEAFRTNSLATPSLATRTRSLHGNQKNNGSTLPLLSQPLPAPSSLLTLRRTSRLRHSNHYNHNHYNHYSRFHNNTRGGTNSQKKKTPGAERILLASRWNLESVLHVCLTILLRAHKTLM